MSYFIFALVLSVTGFLTLKLRERCLYVLFLVAYTQNLVVAWLYTRGYIGTEVAHGLLLFKDFLLLELFLWSIVLLFRRFRRPWPAPLTPLIVLTAYCAFRFLLGSVFLADDVGQGVARMRAIAFPLEILVVVMVLTALNPSFGARFLKAMTYILSGLAVVALAIVLWAPRDFWLQHANIAELQADVKGDVENEMNFEEGLTLGGTMQGREALMFLSSYRAIGTFGEALALAFSMAAPLLLLSLHYKKTSISVLSL